MAKTKATPGTRVITGKARLNFVHVIEPYANNDKQDPAYSLMLLVPKTDTRTIERIRAAQKVALDEGKAKFGGKVPKVWHSTFRDGDDPDEDLDLEEYPEYIGHYFMNVKSKTKPGLVDENRDPIIDGNEIYSGCYANVSLNGFAYNTQGNKGVSFALRAVRKVADGDYLGGRSNADEDFDDMDDEDLI